MAEASSEKYFTVNLSANFLGAGKHILIPLYVYRLTEQKGKGCLQITTNWKTVAFRMFICEVDTGGKRQHYAYFVTTKELKRGALCFFSNLGLENCVMQYGYQCLRLNSPLFL